MKEARDIASALHKLQNAPAAEETRLVLFRLTRNSGSSSVWSVLFRFSVV